MRVLLLTSRFPWPPDRGDRFTTFNLIRALAQTHQVSLVSFTDGREPGEAMAQVAGLCDSVNTVHLSPGRSWAQAWGGILTPQPSQVAFYHSRAMHRMVREVHGGARYDAVVAHLIRMAPYAVDLPHPNKVLWLVDSLGLALQRSMRYAPLWRRGGTAWERWRLDRLTARTCGGFRESWAVSRADVDDLRRLGCRNARLQTFGTDQRLFSLPRKPTEHPHVVFLGNMSVPHNVDAARFAAREIWPLIRASLPRARFSIVGASPVPGVRRLASLPGVYVTGALPDLLDMWSSSDVLLAPLRFSTGVQTKVLEAMAAGVPVVTTPPVAEGLGVRDREHLLTAPDARTIAAAVVESVRDPEAARARARSAREFVRAHFSWDAMVRRLEDLAATAGSGRAPAGFD